MSRVCQGTGLTVSSYRTAVCLAWTLFLPIPSATASDGLPRDYRLGLGHYARGRWDLAADELARLVADHPRDPHVVDARFYLAESLVQLKRYEAARGHFNALRKSPSCRHSARVLFRCAELAYLDGRLVTANNLFRDFTHHHPGHELNGVALGCVGAIALKHEDPFTALRSYGLALEMFPDPAADGERLLGIALALEQSGYRESARRFYAELAPTENVGVADWASLRLGLDHINRQEPAAAVALWADFDRRYPDSTLQNRVRAARAHALRRLGRHGEAARELDAVLQAEPRGPFVGDTLLSRIRTAVAQEDIQAVDVHLRLLRSERPDSAVLGEANWAAARFYVRQRQYRLAVEPLEAFLSQPGREERRSKALAQLVLCYARTGHLQPADARLNMLVALRPGRELIDPVVLELADRCRACSDIERARRLFRDLVSRPTSTAVQARALFGLASVDLATGNRPAAIHTLHRLLDLDADAPQWAEGALLMGSLLQKMGETGKALSIYRQTIEQVSKRPYRRRALLGLARMQHELGRPEEAVATYRRLVDLGRGSDEFDDAVFGLAWILMEQGDEARACEWFTQIHENLPDSPHWPEATYLLAERAFHSRDLDRASALLEALGGREGTGELDPERIASRALYLKGQIAAERRQWVDVLETMSVLLQDFGKTSMERPARYWAAEARYQMGSLERAESLFRQLQSDARGGGDDALAARAGLRYVQILARRKRWTEALDNAILLLKDFPDFEGRYEVDYVAGRSLAALGRLSDARKAYRRAIGSERGSGTETAAMAQWMIGETYMHQKDYARARREFLAVEVLYAYPDWQARSLLEAGKCCELMDEWAAAQQHYSELIDRYPTSRAAEHASRRVRMALIRKDPR